MANNFANDENCVAVWNFESGALLTDSKGGNNLTSYNGGPILYTDSYKQGAACAHYTPPQGSYILDASWSDDYPLKSGKTNQKVSVCGWFYIHVIGSWTAVFSKFEIGWAKRCFKALATDSGGPNFYCSIGYADGASEEALYWGTAPQTGRWYHFGTTFDNTNKAWTFDIWDDTAQTKIIDAGGTATNYMATPSNNTTFVGVGHEWYNNLYEHWNGLIDELVVFKDILTSDEIDLIRQGKYPNPVRPLPAFRRGGAV